MKFFYWERVTKRLKLRRFQRQFISTGVNQDRIRNETLIFIPQNPPTFHQWTRLFANSIIIKQIQINLIIMCHRLIFEFLCIFFSKNYFILKLKPFERSPV